MQIKTILGEKLRESVGSVLPIALIVALLCLFFVPISTDLMLAFVIAVISVSYTHLTLPTTP